MDKATPDSAPASANIYERLRSVPNDAILKIDTPNPLGVDTRSIPVGAMLHEAADQIELLCAEVERLAAQSAPTDNSNGETKLWLWKNFVNGRPEYWAFDNPYPINLDNGDPQTLGEPCGYAILKPSRSGRPDFSEDEVLLRIAQAESKVSYNLDPNKANADAFDFLRFAKKNLDTHAARVPFANNGLVTAAVAWIQSAEKILAAQSAPTDADALTQYADLDKQQTGRLILEASTGMHGEVSAILAKELGFLAERFARQSARTDGAISRDSFSGEQLRAAYEVSTARGYSPEGSEAGNPSTPAAGNFAEWARVWHDTASTIATIAGGDPNLDPQGMIESVQAVAQSAPLAQQAAEPPQEFESAQGRALASAWAEGWAQCRDAEFVGEEAENDAFNQSTTLTQCLTADRAAAQVEPSAPPAPGGDVLEKAYELLGFLEAAQWASRDDLRHDITSPAYLTQRDHDLVALATQAQGQDAAPAEFVKFICVDCTGCEKCRPAARAKE